MTAVLSGAVLAAGAAACGSSADPAPVARQFLEQWGAGHLQDAAGLTTDPGSARATLDATDRALGVTGRSFVLSGTTAAGADASAAYRARLELAGLGTWTYRGSLQMHLSGGRWRVRWTPSDLYPGLRGGQSLSRTRSLPPRAPILGAGGAVLVGPQPVVTVGIVPARVTSLPSTLAVLAQATGVDPTRVRAAVTAAPPQSFVPVITLRRAAYEAVKPAIYSLPGVEFEEGTADLAPTATFALPVLGRVGPATADALRHMKGPYLASDDVGLSGLELAYQAQLAGTPSGAVEVADRAGSRIRTLATFPGHPGSPLVTTLDPKAQEDAEAVLAATSHPAALVALRASTGQIVAAASTPADSSFDRALDSEYPPGSSFKVVTAAALLQSGTVGVDTTVPCPSQAVIDGKPFRNFEGEAPGPVSFATDFAISCNTAFVAEGSRLDGSALTAAAATFGFGSHWSLGLAYFSGQVPAPRDRAELAADAIGQGRVLASPLNMALVAATVATGRVPAPTLLGGAGVSPGAPTASPLSPVVVAALRSLMRGVVTSGTGRAADLAGDPVYGKTGTAEFGSASPPQTHAWFIAFRGDLAVAVLVDGGGVGGQVAAPLAARFLAGYSLPA